MNKTIKINQVIKSCELAATFDRDTNRSVENDSTYHHGGQLEELFRITIRNITNF